MGRLFLGALLVASALAQPAFCDAVVDYDRPPPTFGYPNKYVMHLHGEVARFDSTSQRSNGVILQTQEFTRPGQVATFRISRYEDGGPAYLAVLTDSLSAPLRMAERSFTGEVESHLGETCRAWRVTTQTNHGMPFTRSGCVTADGIELWFKHANIDARLATAIRRVAVPPAEVRPPVRFLDLRAWAGADRSDHRTDYAVTLAERGSDNGGIVVRRSGAWTSRVEHGWKGDVRVQVLNDEEGLALSYFKDDDQRSLTISRRSSSEPKPPESEVRVVDRPGETILGERCDWWNAMPGVADAGRLECRTPEGAPLKVEVTGRGSGARFTAVSFKRARQTFSSLTPDAEFASPSSWGF